MRATRRQPRSGHATACVAGERNDVTPGPRTCCRSSPRRRRPGDRLAEVGRLGLRSRRRRRHLDGAGVCRGAEIGAGHRRSTGRHRPRRIRASASRRRRRVGRRRAVVGPCRPRVESEVVGAPPAAVGVPSESPKSSARPDRRRRRSHRSATRRGRRHEVGHELGQLVAREVAEGVAEVAVLDQLLQLLLHRAFAVTDAGQLADEVVDVGQAEVARLRRSPFGTVGQPSGSTGRRRRSRRSCPRGCPRASPNQPPPPSRRAGRRPARPARPSCPSQPPPAAPIGPVRSGIEGNVPQAERQLEATVARCRG